MSFGLTVDGFETKPLDQILSDMEGVQLAQISPSLDLQSTSILGVYNGIVAQAIFELWQLAAALYNGMDPDGATGDQLTNLALITGTNRITAEPTVVAAQININNGFSALAGTLLAAVDTAPSITFTNQTDISNTSGIAETITVNFVCTQTGPIPVNAHTLVISVPATGWNSIDNAEDGVLGSDIEIDSDLRTKRQEELSQAGSTTADAIKADILKQMQPPAVSSLTQTVTVLFNDTDVTDGNGLPPHSLEAIVYQPGNTSADDLAVAQLILDDKAAGDGTNGNTTKMPTDAEGNAHSISFTRPTEVPIYINITVLIDPRTYPGDGDTLVQDALAGFGTLDFGPGDTVFVKRLQSAVFTEPNVLAIGVPGVLDITVFQIDTHSSPTNTANIPIDVRSVATFSTGRINVSHV